MVVAIGGKTLRRSHDRVAGRGPLRLVRAWATANGQRRRTGPVVVEGTSNEITAIPALREVRALSSCVVTIDAIGCQKGIARTIRARDADDPLALTDHHPQLGATRNSTGDRASMRSSCGAGPGGRE